MTLADHQRVIRRCLEDLFGAGHVNLIVSTGGKVSLQD
jgi:hypothetical protein